MLGLPSNFILNQGMVCLTQFNPVISSP